ncbi:MAG: LysM peptidoglycan-binding domain-containing protein [Chloroflexi bacterium]|nr:LysM peptidoglycan-binding domain-containing protein [Chloroflexota bacterium]
MKTCSPLTLKRAFSILAVVVLLTTILPPATVAAPPKDGTIVYFVQYGDTLFSISRRFATTVPAIMSANGLASDYIYVGQRLIVPVGVSYPPPAPPAQNFGCKYTVQFRDTIFSIAYRYRVSVASLMQANFLYSPYIFVGQQLNVPCINPPPPAFPMYTVKQGDNLFRIAIQYGTTIYAIAVVNGIPNPNLIFVGQNLVIPYPNTVVYPTVPTITPSGTGTPTVTPTATATITGTTGGACTGTCPVVMRNLAYEPQSLTVTAGSTVTWLNIDTVTHTVTAGTPGNITPNSFRSSQLGTNQTYNFTFNTAGTYQYFCEIHGAQMTGTIIVQ